MLIFSITLYTTVAASFSSLLKKLRYTLLTINHSNASLDSIAVSQVRTIVKDARKHLAIFLIQAHLETTNP